MKVQWTCKVEEGEDVNLLNMYDFLGSILEELIKKSESNLFMIMVLIKKS
jgi:hypothetical protein